MVVAITDIVKATRPWSFSASLLPSFLGAVLAYKDNGTNGFSAMPSICAMACVLCVHCAGNLVNTYYDYINGLDDTNSSDKTIVAGILPPSLVYKMFLAAYGTGFLFLLLLVQMSTSKSESLLVLMYLLGMIGSFFYTGGVGLKYLALGDVVIFLTFGPVVTYFTYIAQCNSFSLWLSWEPMLYTIPLVFHIEAILHGNNVRDYAMDKKGSILTLPILVGLLSSSWLYLFLLGFPYIVVSIFAFTESVYFVLPLVTSPLAFNLIGKFRNGDLGNIPEESAQLNLIFGSLYITAFILQ